MSEEFIREVDEDVKEEKKNETLEEASSLHC